MKKIDNKKIVFILIASLILFFNVCGQNKKSNSVLSENNIVYKEVTFSEKWKRQDDKYGFCEIDYKYLTIKLIEDYQINNDDIAYTLIKYSLDGKQIKDWGKIEIVNYNFRLFYSPKRNDYYFLIDCIMDGVGDYDGEIYDVYHITNSEVDYVGNYVLQYPELKDKINYNDYYMGLKVNIINEEFYLSLATRNKKDLLFKEDNTDANEVLSNNKPIDKSLLRKADSFDWEKAFTTNINNQDFNLDELLKIVSDKKKEYVYDEKENVFSNKYLDFDVYPKPEEIIATLNKTPLSVQTVQKYNDIAFYVLEFAKSYSNTNNYTNTAITILENITSQFPDRVVAFLNLGDAYWYRNNQTDIKKAQDAYKKYIDLMLSQNKDMKKIPTRVYERITK